MFKRLFSVATNRVGNAAMPSTKVIMPLCAVEICYLTNRVSDYPYISQGKTRIPGVNDSADGEITDVSKAEL